MNRYYHDIIIAIESILSNKIKSILTALGIIFGVAAVISMLAIGNGAQEEILKQIEMVGVNNIVITPVLDENDDKESADSDEKMLQKYSPGLHFNDVDAIKKIIPTVKVVSPEISKDTYVIQNGRRRSARLVGVSPIYFEIFGHELSEGQIFNDYQNIHGKTVCIISDGIKQKVFKNASPIGKVIKCDNGWLTIIGVLKKAIFC